MKEKAFYNYDDICFVFLVNILRNPGNLKLKTLTKTK